MLITTERDIMLATLPLHQHIDNGGYTYEVFEYGTLRISESFFGYATSTIELHRMNPDHLRELAAMLCDAADGLEKME